ncbi:MAG: ATP-dependent DNA helicase RecQ [Myxococcota bacterium]
MAVDLETQLRERFGLEAFRPWQREAIEHLLEPKPVLVVAPTGGGKSLTYQLPATLLGGTSVVISPLIALMEDQVRGLMERGIEATFLASSLDLSEIREREEGLRKGRYDLVFVAPERLKNARAVDFLRSLKPPLVAIDEAHCISQWGHDFRPDYLRLGKLLRQLKPRHVLACTATATPVVRDEILERLEIRDAHVVLRGFARPNLHLEATPLDSSNARRRRMEEAIREALGSPKDPKGAAIVYAATRKNAEKTAQQIGKLGYRSAAYHAGLSAQRRATVGDAFAARELDVVTATNAFGMGIDRPDIRLVVHVQAPGSIEAYYQEVGRAGRDGDPAFGLLMSSSSDLALRRRLIERAWDPAQVVAQSRIDQQWKLFLDLMRYVEAGSCRHDFILRYFGDDEEILGGCGHCDVCARLEDATEGDDDEATLVVRKALAGVARARGRVGMKAVAEMLAGRDNAKTRRMALTKLSTFGILKGDVEWVMALLRRLITAGYANVTADEYPVLYLTRLGADVMTEKHEARLLLPPRKTSRARRKRRVVMDGDTSLFERLRATRLELARREGVPAYLICSDRTLAQIAKDRPATEAELLKIHGMGPSRVAAYGASLLAVL